MCVCGRARGERERGKKYIHTRILLLKTSYGEADLLFIVIAILWAVIFLFSFNRGSFYVVELRTHRDIGRRRVKKLRSPLLQFSRSLRRAALFGSLPNGM